MKSENNIENTSGSDCQERLVRRVVRWVKNRWMWKPTARQFFLVVRFKTKSFGWVFICFGLRQFTITNNYWGWQDCGSLLIEYAVFKWWPYHGHGIFVFEPNVKSTHRH
jgi:hypothetical protein